MVNTKIILIMQLSKKKYSIIKRIEKHVKLTMEKNQK